MRISVVFGAGSIGRGFIGQLFSESGYEVVFVDVDVPLLQALNAEGGYTIDLVENERTVRVRVGPVRAVHAQDTASVASALARAEVAATAVGARALAQIAPALAAGVRQRQREGVSGALNCIVCENLKDAARALRDLVRASLAAEEQAYLARHVGFVDTVIGRMVPPPTPEMRARSPTAIRAEPYKELPVDQSGFVEPVPPVAAMQLCERFETYVARKLYVHNCGHAVLAYLGHLRGYTYGYEALKDPEIEASLCAAWDESIAGQVACYGVQHAWLRAHTDDLRRRFANRALGDTIARLGRDPARKIGPTDRLVAPARLAESAGIQPRALARTIAAALCFDPPADPGATALQDRLSHAGLDAVLAEVCGIASHEPLAAAIRACYASLRRTSAGASVT